MTNEEAITILKDKLTTAAISREYSDSPVAAKVCNADVEAFTIALDAIDKQIPMKPIKVSNTISRCKRCGYNVRVAGRQTVFDYCDVCGQAQDWSDEDGMD